MENFKLGGNHNDSVDELEETETPEDIAAAFKNIQDLKRGDGVLVRMTKQQLGVIAKTLAPPEDIENFPNLIQFLMIGDYIDEDEADKVTAAFNEAKRFGMDIQNLVIWVANRLAANRKGIRNNRAAQIYDTFSHQKLTNYQPVRSKRGDINPNSRTPLN